MGRYAIIDTQPATDVVRNVVEWDGNPATWQPPPGHIAVDLGPFAETQPWVGRGDTWNGSSFTDVVTPEEVEGANRSQVIAALKAVRDDLAPIKNATPIDPTGLTGHDLAVVTRLNLLLQGEQRLADAVTKIGRILFDDYTGTD